MDNIDELPVNLLLLIISSSLRLFMEISFGVHATLNHDLKELLVISEGHCNYDCPATEEPDEGVNNILLLEDQVPKT